MNKIKENLKSGRVRKERVSRLLEAAREQVVRVGLSQVTLRGIAEEAGMSPSAVLYYYPEIQSLLDEVQTKAIDRFITQRAALVAKIQHPVERLRHMIEGGLPSNSQEDRELCKLLIELAAYSRIDRGYASRHIALFERQVGIYVEILAAGAISGDFKLACEIGTIARTLVLLEDGAGLHIINVLPAIEFSAATRLIKTYASTITACPALLLEDEKLS